MTKSERKVQLLAQLDAHIKSGISPADAIEKLSLEDYDFLVDAGVDFDSLILTPEQMKVVSEVKRAPRTVKEGGYNKKYPQSKMDLYNAIAEFVQSNGAEIIPRDKLNYRDLDFVLGNTHYKIVLSNPRS